MFQIFYIQEIVFIKLADLEKQTSFIHKSRALRLTDTLSS